MESIISRETMRNRGRQAHAAGKGRDDHDMNPWVLAIPDWQAGWDEAAAVAKRAATTSPQSHAMGAAVLRFDPRHAGATS